MFYIVKLGRKTSHQTYKTSEEISEQTEKIVENLYLIKISSRESDQGHTRNFFHFFTFSLF